MVRPVSKTSEAVLQATVALFRRKGYAGATLRDLEEATGLHPGSLYRSYGNKDELFAASLRNYNEAIVDPRIRKHLLEAQSPLAGIRAYLTSVFERPEGENPGCLLTNSAIEAHSLDESARPLVLEGLAAIEHGLETAIMRAVECAELPASARPAELAGTLLALYQGILVLTRFGWPKEKLTATVDAALAAIAAAPAKGRRRER